MAANIYIHDLVYPRVFGAGQYIGQFSDNSVDELKQMGTLMSLPGGSEVLDVGCGRGSVARFMASTFGWKVTGIDIAGVPIADALLAHGGSADSSLTFIQDNIYSHAFARQFAGIYGTGAFCHFDAARLFSRASSLLRAGGRIGFMDAAGNDWRR